MQKHINEAWLVERSAYAILMHNKKYCSFRIDINDFLIDVSEDEEELIISDSFQNNSPPLVGCIFQHFI